MANTVANLSAVIQAYYDKLLLEWGHQTLVMDQFAQKRDIPKYKGVSITFTRFLTMALATTPLGEGANPSGTNLNAVNVLATLAEYGAYTQISSLLSATSLDPEVESAIPLLGEQMACTLDYLTMAAVVSGATNQVVSTQTNMSAITATDILTMKDIRIAKRNMTWNLGLRFKNGYFVLLVDPSQLMDLEADTTWVNSAVYKDNERLFTGEAGKWYGCRVVETTQPYLVTTAGSPVYVASQPLSPVVHSALLLGRESYGQTRLEGGYTSKIIIKRGGEQDTSNPLSRFGTLGWTMPFVAKVLNSNWIINIETGATGG